MKKKIGLAAGLAGILLVIIGSILKRKENTAISVVGGADGPTSVFVAGRLGGEVFIGAIALGVILIVAAILMVLKKKY